MTENDIEEVMILETSVFLSHPDPDGLKKACMCKENVYMVAENEGGIIAYCTVVTSYETADLCNIAVRENYRKKHIAQRLLSECILQCKSINVERMLLEVRESNIPAILFYRKMDFLQIGKRKGYYSQPAEDAIIMEKVL